MRYFICLLLMSVFLSFGTAEVLCQLMGEQKSESKSEAKGKTRKAVIKYRPEPEYTLQAQANRTSGSVVLQLILSASGEVVIDKVLKGLPDGLTEACIRAARKIKFEPALKGGQPVPQYQVVVYNFNR